MSLDATLLDDPDLEGPVERTAETAPLDDGSWYEASDAGAVLGTAVDPGTLSGDAHLAADALLDGEHLARFELRLHAGEATFRLGYGLLQQCQARLRLPLARSDQDRWKLEREGAWLKPLVDGDRVDPARVERVEVALTRTGGRPVRWCQAPIRVLEEPADRLREPLLPAGPLVDELGQSRLHEWPGRTEDADAMVARLERQRERAASTDPGEAWPDAFSRWGGWTDRQFEATGVFRTEHDGERWWLVDPDGHPFWSAGLDCVRPHVRGYHGGLADAMEWCPATDGPFGDARFEDPPATDFLRANLRRAFGDEWDGAWGEVALDALRRAGFNTVGNWSDWRVASEAGVPYVRPLSLDFPEDLRVFRDFPDVHDEAALADAAAEVAEPLAETAGDPALVGYFLGNEPTWAFATESPAAGMLYTTESCASRSAFADWLADRHADLGAAWELDVAPADVAEGRWDRPLTEPARADCREFSAVLVERLYRELASACRAVDPDHLNLGTRYPYLPGDYALAGMEHVDVFSVNCYDETVDPSFGAVSERLGVPVLVGEWHFGALDVGLPATGLEHVPDQADRGRAYRRYLETAAAKPWCVGAHYFTLYDHSALGRFDGENYQIGFHDVCHRPYGPLVEAARASHERVHAVAAGDAAPFEDAPEYRPGLF